MEYKSEQISKQDLMFEVKWRFSGLIHRLEGLEGDMKDGFNDLNYVLGELNKRI